MIDRAPGFELLLILAPVLLNGVLATSEIAVVSARRPRLRHGAAKGDAGARRALYLAEHPTTFLSTVQIGITLVSVFAGAFGGASLARPLESALQGVPYVGPVAEEAALAIVVAAIGFLTLVAGGLAPKRIALHHPERIAALVAGPMHAFSVAASPVVRLLSVCTDGLLRLLGIRPTSEPAVTQGR